MSPPRCIQRIALPTVALLCAVTATPASADPVPDQASWQETWFSSGDGTMLHADVFLPVDRDDHQTHPVILSIGPYFGSGGSAPREVTPLNEGPVLRFRDLMYEGRIFERDFAYVQVDLRGTGGSQGCYDLGGPGEQMDVKAAVEWAARQPWSNGRVGMWGKSYDAWTQVMALATRPKGLAAAVIQAPLASLYRGLHMNGISYGWYSPSAAYGIGDLKPPSVADSSPQELIFGLDGVTKPTCYAENLAFTLGSDDSLPYYRARDLVARASKSRVPTLWSHGFLDANTKPDNFIDIYEGQNGPKRAWLGQFHHVRGNEAGLVGRVGFMAEAMNWLDHHLKDTPLRSFPSVEVQDNEGRWRAETQWPPDDAIRYELSMNPGAYLDARGSDAWDPARGIWTVTQPAPYDVRFAGEPRLDANVESVAPDVNMISLLYEVAPDGTARLITRGAIATPPGRVVFDLYPQDWILRKGNRLALHVSGSDESWFSPVPSHSFVELSAVRLSLPFLRYRRVADLEGGRAAAMAWVPEIVMSSSTIAENERVVRYPPRMRPRTRTGIEPAHQD